jgi:pimeloyl-ACP methyl ester carboxylesterase
MHPVRVETRAGSFAALELGSGPGTLLCLHGFPDTPRSFAPLAHFLAPGGWRVVMPWLRGYAPSTLDGPFDPLRLGDDVVALADALSPDAPIAVVGHDWGAIATYAALVAAPERFSRAVTIAVPHPSTFVENVRKHPRQLARSGYMAFFQVKGLADWALRLRDFALVERLWKRWSPGFFPTPEHMDEVKRCLAESLPAPLEMYRDAARAFARGVRFPEEKIRVPLLHLQGADDGCIGPELSEGEERFFAAQFRRDVLPEVGHFLHLERPAAVARRVLEWLQ